MWVFSPRRNCSLSTLAEKKSTPMRSMITATAKTRQIAIGYMPKPPPFQWCAIVSKSEVILFPSLWRKSSSPTGLPRAIWVPLSESAIGRLLLLSGTPCRPHPIRRKQASPARLRCVRFRASMAREVTFPRTRHIALSGVEQAAEAKAAGSEAILVPIRDAAEAQGPAGVPLPPPAEPGAAGVPEKGALPAAAPVPALAAGTGSAAPQTRELPWVVSV